MRPETGDWQRAYTSPATCMFPAREIAPLETTSPTTPRVPAEVVEIAAPGTPPHPASLSAAMVGEKRRLSTLPVAVAEMFGGTPLLKMRANCSCSERAAVIRKL